MVATMGVNKNGDVKTPLKQWVDVRLAVLGLRASDISRMGGFSEKQLYVWMQTGVDRMKVGSLRRLAKVLQLDPEVLLRDCAGIPKEITESRQ